MFLMRASAVATRSNRPPRAFSFAPRSAARSLARPGPSAAVAAAAAFPLRRGTLSDPPGRPVAAAVLILYRTAGARPAGTGGSPSPFSLGSRGRRRPRRTRPQSTAVRGPRTVRGPVHTRSPGEPAGQRHGVLHGETHTRDTPAVVHMGHGRREPPEQGGADERVDGNRREPVLGLARARRFRPTRQSGRREEEMDEHQRLVREGREGQETQKVAGPAGAQEKVLSVRSPAVPDAVRPGLEGRRPAGRRGAEQEAAAKGRAVRSASGGRGGRPTRNAAGRAVPAGRRPVVHGVAVARRQHVGRTAKDRLQNRRVATARPDQVQRRATAVRRARPPVFPGGLSAVPVRRQPARGRVVHATPTTARPGRGHELIVRVRHASRQTGDGRLESADLVAIRVRPRTARRRRRRRRRRQSRFRRPRPRRQNRFRQLGRTIFRTNVSTAFPRHNVQYVLLVFRLTISAIAYILYIT